MNRREFVVGSAAALVVAAAGGSYVFSSCPLDTDKTGVCTGPCLAFIDWDGDGHCDRVPAPVLAHAVTETAGSQQTTKIGRVCPFGLISDPYPGQCHLYMDENGDGLCDLSQGEITTNAKDDQMPVPDEAAPDQPLAGAGPVLTACPLGLINDPHPGECQRYIDENGNGLCDLSEPDLVTMETLVLPSQVVGSGHQGQQRRRGQ